MVVRMEWLHHRITIIYLVDSSLGRVGGYGKGHYRSKFTYQNKDKHGALIKHYSFSLVHLQVRTWDLHRHPRVQYTLLYNKVYVSNRACVLLGFQHLCRVSAHLTSPQQPPSSSSSHQPTPLFVG